MKVKKRFYFSTHDLMMMAAFAAVGGIASTYINMIGDAFQSFLGFAGTTQWAAGLHIIWLMLTAVIIRKPGAASTAGLLKGGVELFSGNTHGLLIVIVDIIAGVIIDLIFLFNNKNKFNLTFYLAAGLASASNVFVFQLFASAPSDIMTIVIIAAASLGAFISGVIFGGVLVRSLLISVEKAGIYKPSTIIGSQKKISRIVIISFCILCAVVSGFVYIRHGNNTGQIKISGAGHSEYVITADEIDFNLVEITAELNGVDRIYQGYKIREFIEQSHPMGSGNLLLIKAYDGYSFFISMEEVFENDDLLLSPQDGGNSISFNVVGAYSPKAWVRGVNEIIISRDSTIDVMGKINEPFAFQPQDWQEKMDSLLMKFESGEKKLQGVILSEILAQADPIQKGFLVEVITGENKVHSIRTSDQPKRLNDVGIYVLPESKGISFVLGSTNGDVILENVAKINVK